ncbi:MAG: cytochrome c biogenesis protein CcdA [Planctomycetaceae bacterium]
MLRFPFVHRSRMLVRVVSLTFSLLILPGIVLAQNESGGLLGGQLSFGNTSKPDADVEISAVLKNLDGGKTELQVTAVVPEGYYIYSMNPSFTGATKLVLTDTGTLTTDAKPQWQADHEPKAVFEKELDQTVEKFFGSVTWSTTLQGTADADTVVKGKLNGLYCSSPDSGGGGECVPLRNKQFMASLAESAASPDAAAGSEEILTPTAGINPDKNPITVTPKIGYGKAAKEGLIQFEIGLSPARPQIGDEIILSIRAVIQEPWHTFALDQDPEMAGQPTSIELSTTKGLEPIGNAFKSSVEPEIVRPLSDVVQRVHSHEVTWSHRFTLTEPAAELDGLIRFQMCNDGSCLPPAKAEFALTLTAGSALSESGDGSDLANAPLVKRTSESNEQDHGPQQGFLAFVVTAAAAGFLALLTPCVFPMIPVTVAFFLKQEEKHAGSSIKLAMIYSFSIICAFTILGLIVAGIFGPASLNTLANNKWLNLFFAALFLIFSLMLLGVFEIQIPSSLLTWTSKRESTGGVVGVIFMALTFTLVSFTCTFAFVGSLLAWAAQGQVFWPVVGMLAFSAAFASPFFLLALFPSMLKRLPRSGGWMNDVKVTMGIVELALVAKFLSVADIGFSVGSIPVYITYKGFLVSWIILSVIAGVYLLGLFRKSTGPLTPSVKMVRNSFALMFLTFAGYITAGLYVPKMPLTVLWDNVAAFAPPNVIVRNTEAMGFVISHHELDYALEFKKATAAAESEQRPMFIDFTGVNCVNCRKMERSVLVDEAVLQRLNQLVRAQLYTDLVPGIRDKEFAEQLITQNQGLQDDLVGDFTLPFYAVVSADGTEVLASFQGLDRSGGEDFIKFLDAGLESWEAKKQAKVSAREMVIGGLTP